MTSFKSILRGCLFVLCWIFSFQQAHASHSMGANLTYSCLGNDRYEITLSFYRDCVGILPDLNAIVNVQSSCYPDAYIVLSQVPGTGQEITPVCSTEVTTCQGGTYTGIQEYVYTATVQLPANCNDWLFSYDLCCRNAAITTILNPDINNMYIYAMLDNTVTPCNSSPVFSNRPVPFVCLGQEFCFNHGAYDVDGDSLVYSLITPYGIYGSQVSYIPPYSAQNPLITSPAMTFNTATGDFCMTPTQLDVTVMAVLVEEYRNGVRIGSVERDIQITVIPCTNVIPELTGINGTTNFSMNACADQPFCFDINSSDQDAPQNTYITWDYSIPGATFTTTGGARETGTFCWTPSQSDISNVPHCFTVTVMDDNCPYAGSQTYSYCITVQGPRVTATAGTLGCNVATTTVSAAVAGSGGGVTYHWNTGATTSSINVGPGTYIVEVTKAGCTSFDTVVVAPGSQAPTAAFTLTSTCSGTDVVFTNQSTTTGGAISGYVWSFGDGVTSTVASPNHTYPAPGTYTVTLVAQDPNGCNDTLRQSITLAAVLPTAAFTTTPVCIGQTMNFQNQSTSSTGFSNYQWSFGDGNTSSSSSPTNNYSAAGTYNVTLTVTNSGGCTSTITQPVTVHPLPMPNAGNNALICEGASATLTASGGGNYLWSPGGSTTSTTVVTPAQSQNYIVTVTDINGCVSSDTVRVDIQPTPSILLSAPTSICLGASTTLSVSSSGSLNYNWQPGGSTASQITVAPTSTSTFFVTATDNVGCVISDSVEVVVWQNPTAAISTTDALCFGSSDGSATASPVGGTAPYSYDWLTVSGNGPVQNTLSFGNYQVAVIDVNGCRDTIPYSIGQPTALSVTSAVSPAACFGGNTGSVTVTVSGGTNGYSYSWFPIGATTPTVSSLSAGVYSVTVTDANGCTSSVSSTVGQPNALVVALATTPALCNGLANGTANVNVSGGTSAYSFSWFPSGSTAASATGLSAGWHRVTINDANGCIITDSVQVVEPTQVSAITNSIPATCGVANGSATVTASGGTPVYQYTWSPGGATGAAVSGLLAGTYNVTVTDRNGCAKVVLTTVVNIGAPVVAAGVISDVSCSGGADGQASVRIVSGNGPFTYSWPGGVTNDTLFNRGAGTYSVEVTDANGCVALDTVTIQQPTPLISTATSLPVTCNDAGNGSASASANGGTPGYNYQWNPGGLVGSSIQSLGAGNYTVTVTDRNGCSVNSTVTVTQPDPITLSYTSTPADCFGSSTGSAFVQASGGVGAIQLQWLNLSIQNDTATGLQAGNYTVLATDDNGCATQLQVDVVEPDPVSGSVNTDTVSCSGAADGLLQATAAGGNGNYQFVWQPVGINSAQANGLTAGNYSVLITDQNGCSVTLNTVIVDPDPVSLSISTPPILCIGQQTLLTANASGGTQPFQFNWNTGISSDSLTVSPVVTTDYSVVAIDANGCATAPQLLTVQVYPPLQISVDDLPLICGGDTATLFAAASGGNGGPYNYSWNDSAIIGATSTIRPLNDSTFVVIATDGCSPSIIDSVSIDVYPLPQVEFTPQQINGCTPVIVDFANLYTAPTGSVYQWNLDDNAISLDSTPTHAYTIPGTYDVSLTITTPQGCQAEQIVTQAVQVYGFPEAAFDQSTESVSMFTPGVTFSDISTDAITWQWDFGDGIFETGNRFPSHVYGDSGTYVVQLIVTSEGGCPDTTYGVVRIEPEFSIFIPNAFTPNGDGHNDGFIAMGKNIIDYEMWIIDRWGLEIFHSVSFTHPWDGTYYDNGNPCQSDVYEYIIAATDIKGLRHRYIGHVTLVR